MVQKGGGSVGQSLRYVDPSAPEQTAPAGSNLLVERGLIARPAIGGGTRKSRRGGFYPSIMGGVVNAGMVSAPLAAVAARKLLSRKTRKGGAKKERWLAQKEEAKAILQGYGKPTAINIQKFALAKRRSSDAAEAFLEEFRRKAQEKRNRNEAKRASKEAKKAERARKKAEKEAAKATKKASKPKKNTTKKTPKGPVRKGTHLFFNNEGRVINTRVRTPLVSIPAKKGTHLFFNNEGRVIEGRVLDRAPTHRELRLLAEANAARAREAVAKVVAKGEKTRKSPSAKSKAYFAELRKAREFLGTVGRPTGANMAKFASLKLKGANTSAWVEEFKTRRPLAATAAPAAARAASPPEAARPALTTAEAIRAHGRAIEAREARNRPAAAATTATVKAKKEHSAKSRAYFNGLKSAREYLSTIGRPTGPNMSKFASMKLKGENTTAWEENFKTRRPLGAEPAGKTRKKPLTAVKEEAENSNEE
jgi:hypothetical protein